MRAKKGFVLFLGVVMIGLWMLVFTFILAENPPITIERHASMQSEQVAKDNITVNRNNGKSDHIKSLPKNQQFTNRDSQVVANNGKVSIDTVLAALNIKD